MTDLEMMSAPAAFGIADHQVDMGALEIPIDATEKWSLPEQKVLPELADFVEGRVIYLEGIEGSRPNKRDIRDETRRESRCCKSRLSTVRRSVLKPCS